MAKKDKTVKKAVSMKGKKLVTADEKAKMKSDMKAMKVEKDAALKEGDKKKIKAIRYKLKKAKGKLRHVVVPVAPKAEAAAAS